MYNIMFTICWSESFFKRMKGSYLKFLFCLNREITEIQATMQHFHKEWNAEIPALDKDFQDCISMAEEQLGQNRGLRRGL